MPTRAAPRLPLIQFLERRPRRDRVVGVVVAAAVACWLVTRAVARTLLDRWWFDSVTEAPIWSRRTTAQLQVGLATAAVVAVVLGGTVWWVLRVDRTDHGRRHRMIERYHDRLGPAHRWMLIGLAAYLTWHIGRAAGGQWQSWLLVRYGGSTGTSVPEIGGDIGFHLFRLPFLSAASAFLRQLVALSLVVAVLGHGASGALRGPRHERGSSPAAVRHIAALGIGFLVLQAAHELFVARPATATNRIGAFDGPGFTEVNVTRPALVVTAAVLLGAVGVVVAGLRPRRWRASVVVLAFAAVLHLIVLVAAPVLVERLIVAPAEADRQLWSVEHNRAATLTAYDLADVEIVTQPIRDGIEQEGLTADAVRLPVFRTDQLANALQVQAGTAGTRVGNVDLERYVLDDVERPVYVAARSSNRADLPERGWVQEHLVYTHGDGIVTFAADVVDRDGRPDLGSAPELAATAHAPLYFGEGLDGWYVIVGSRRAEVGGGSYGGEGVGIGSWFRRAALSLATGEPQPVVSSEITDDSVLLYRRGLRERLAAIAPFLRFDSDPYAVVDGERVVWVVDGYTTSSTYPYSQFLPAGVSVGTPATSDVNYVRASVRATVDAVDGTVHLYRTDDGDDPIISVWDEVLPGLFESSDDLPLGVATHLRYPTDLFLVQSAMLARYHVSAVEDLFSGVDRWTISPAAATTVADENRGPAPVVDLFVDAEFSATRTYGPGAADNPGATRDALAGVAIAPHRAQGSPRLLVPRLLVPRDDVLLSPQVAQSAIDADPRLAQDITLLNANGSHVDFGPMSPLLIGDGMVWARSITVTGTGPASVPRLYGIAVISDGLVGLGPTLDDAIDSIGHSAAE